LSRDLILALACLVAVGCRQVTDAPTPGVVQPPPPPVVAEQLPVLALSTADGAPITSKDVYVNGTYRLTDIDRRALNSGTLEVRGRGNTTWGMPKKPYRLRLTGSTALLGMPASRHWILLANFSDKTLMRNDVVFELSRKLGMEYTVRSQFVELQLNGNYEGVYQLTEQIRIAKDRVNIPELKVTDTGASAISGGYLVEIDERYGENFCSKSAMTPMVWCLADPETLRDPAWAAQRQYVEAMIRQADQAIMGPQFGSPTAGYASVIDVESAINYYLLNELFKNVDGNLRLSTYLYKKRDGKIFFGPFWDFDLAIGNVNYDNADKVEGWHTRNAPWFRRMFEDPAFEGRVKARWAQLRREGVIDNLDAYITTRRRYLSKVQVKNFERWPILGTYVWPNRVVTGSYDAEVAAMQGWLFQRMQWMNTQL
jgi:hypothetical protein